MLQCATHFSFGYSVGRVYHIGDPMLSVHVGHVLIKIIYSSNSSHFLGKCGELILSDLELGIYPPKAPSFTFPVLGIFMENATGGGTAEHTPPC